MRPVGANSTSSKAVQAKESILPPLTDGDPLTLHDLKSEQHFTQPPPRYTEASLIERWKTPASVGRAPTPPTVSIIQERGYVERRERRLHPTDLGNVVNDLLVEQFPDVVDASFTAKMEDDLDQVAEGNTDRGVPVVREFWEPFAKAVAAAEETVEKLRIEDEPTDEVCPECQPANGHQAWSLWAVPGLHRFPGMPAYPAPCSPSWACPVRRAAKTLSSAAAGAGGPSTGAAGTRTAISRAGNDPSPPPARSAAASRRNRAATS